MLLRLSLLLFGSGAGPASADFGDTWLLWGGMATVVVGVVGMLGARDLGKLAGYNVLISSGTLLGVIGLQHPAVTAGALAYLVISTLAIAAFFLLAGMLAPDDEAETTPLLEPYDPAGEALYADEDENRATLPAPVALLGMCFLVCALVLAGLPPLSGFLAKFAILSPLLAPGAPVTSIAWGLLVALILSGFATLISMTRAGIDVFWASPAAELPRVRVIEVAPVLMLLALCLALTVQAGPVMRYMEATARDLHAPHPAARPAPPAADPPPAEAAP